MTNSEVHGQARSRSAGTRMRRIGAAAIGVAALTLASCTVGAPTVPNPLVGTLTTRTVDVTISGSTTYAVDDAAADATGGPAGFAISYNGSSLVTSVQGTLAYGTGAALTLDLTTAVTGTTGSAVVTDSGAGVAVTVNGPVAGLVVDDLGNVSGSIASGGRTVQFSTVSVGLPTGTDEALESLLAEESGFCKDAQQRLAGLNEAEVPLSSIANTREPSRKDFASSKATLVPLTTRSWSDTTDVTTQGGDHATITQHISCKTRAADHVSTTGVATSAVDAPCSTLNQRSIDLALAQMTPAEQAAVTLPVLAADVVRGTGAEWTTPLPAGVEFNSNVLTAHALLTLWSDPALIIFPDTIRGVHYCTTWSPAYAYTYLLSTIAA